MQKSFRYAMRQAAAAGLVALSLLLAGCAGDPGAPDLPIDRTAYRLGPGDQLQVAVFGQEEMTGEYFVDNAGNIPMALIGQVPADGRTVTEVEQEIAERLTPEYLNDPKVSVQVLNHRPFFIVGEVKQPGSYPYVDDLVVMTAVALAGGLTYRADEDDFYIIRKSDPERVQRAADPNTPVQPGDLVTVRERFF